MKRSELMKKMRESKAPSAMKTLRRAVRVLNKAAAKAANVPTIKVLISLPPSLNRQLDKNAARHGIFKSLLVRQLIVKNRARVGKP